VAQQPGCKPQLVPEPGDRARPQRGSHVHLPVREVARGGGAGREGGARVHGPRRDTRFYQGTIGSLFVLTKV